MTEKKYKPLTQEEILALLKGHDVPRQEPETCRTCNSPLAPMIESGRVRYTCFMCDEPPTPS